MAKRGDVRDSDGRVYWGRCNGNELWLLPDKFEKRRLMHKKLNAAPKMREAKRRRYLNMTEEQKQAKRDYDNAYRASEHGKKVAREYRERNRERINKQDVLRKKNNPQYKIAMSLRNRIGKSLARKTESSKFYLGCSIGTYVEYIESMMSADMTWDNYGSLWHIDHIVPINTFDLNCTGQQLKAFNYKNTRPLLAKENLSRPKNGSDIT